jgi:hypothetical protein
MNLSLSVNDPRVANVVMQRAILRIVKEGDDVSDET